MLFSAVNAISFKSRDPMVWCFIGGDRKGNTLTLSLSLSHTMGTDMHMHAHPKQGRNSTSSTLVCVCERVCFVYTCTFFTQCKYVQVVLYVCVCVCVYMCIHMPVCLGVCVYMCIRKRVCVCTGMYGCGALQCGKGGSPAAEAPMDPHRRGATTTSTASTAGTHTTMAGDTAMPRVWWLRPHPTPIRHQHSGEALSWNGT